MTQFKIIPTMNNNSKSIMAQYTNSTHASGEWRFSRDYIPFKESIVVAFVLLYGLRIQLQKQLAKEFTINSKVQRESYPITEHLNELVRTLPRLR